MTFDEALKILDIEIYKNRIIHSNSHGELFHLADYILLAKYWNKKRNELPEFRPIFVDIVTWAENTWERPESIFQHILKQLKQ